MATPSFYKKSNGGEAPMPMQRFSLLTSHRERYILLYLCSGKRSILVTLYWISGAVQVGAVSYWPDYFHSNKLFLFGKVIQMYWVTVALIIG